MYTFARLLIFAPVAALLAGCANPDVTQPVADFLKSTNDAKGVLTTDQTAIDKSRLDTAYAKAVSPTATVYWDGCALGDQVKLCHVYVDDGSGPIPLNERAINHNVLVMMGDFASYVDNLNKIAGAKTASEVDTAAGKTKASISAAAANAQKLFPNSNIKAVSAYSGPIIGLASFGLQRIVERKKVRALIQATDAMQPIIDQAAIAFGLVSTQASDLRGAEVNANFVKAEKALRKAPHDQSKVKTLGDAADKFDEYLSLNTKQIFADLASAHGAIRDALHNRNMTFEQLWPYLNNISGNVTKFAELIKQLKDAG